MFRSMLLMSVAAAIAAPIAAANYSAKLATPASGRIIAREINWACGAAGCQGATADSRPPVLCEALAKQVGRVDAFLVDGRAFTDAELAKCNAAAKADSSKKLAAQ